MDMKNLVFGAIAIGGLAVIVLTSVLVVNQYAYVLRTPTNTSINSITFAANNSLTGFGTSYLYPYSVTGCVNATNGSVAIAAANYTVFEGGLDGGGIILKDSGYKMTGWVINCSSVTYRAANEASTSAGYFASGLQLFGAMIGVLIMSYIGVMIWRIFAKEK